MGHTRGELALALEEQRLTTGCLDLLVEREESTQQEKAGQQSRNDPLLVEAARAHVDSGLEQPHAQVGEGGEGNLDGDGHFTTRPRVVLPLGVADDELVAEALETAKQVSEQELLVELQRDADLPRLRPLRVHQEAVVAIGSEM